MRERDELVGVLAPRRQHRYHPAAVLLGGHDPAGGALDARGIRHGRPAELHDHRVAARPVHLHGANDTRAAGSFRPVPAQPVRRRLAIIVLAALALAEGVSGIVVGANHNGGDGGPSGPVPEAGRAEPKEQVSFLARIVPPAADRDEAARGPAVPRSVADLARRLPLERKVAQLFLFGFQGTDATAEIFGGCAGSTSVALSSPDRITSTPPSSAHWRGR